MLWIWGFVNADVAAGQVCLRLRELQCKTGTCILCATKAANALQRAKTGGEKVGSMRILLVLGAVATLAACGGGRVTGVVSDACLGAGRSAASPQLCSCVQQVANQNLSRRDQARAASFFVDPQRAQDTRQSDNPNDEAFWLRYRAFSDRAALVCRAVAA